MINPYTDYDRAPLEIWEDPSFSVYSPWEAQVLGVFPTRAAAETFLKAVYEESVATARDNAVEFYIDKAGEHRWRVTAKNGNIVAASTEGYSNRVDAEKNFLELGR